MSIVITTRDAASHLRECLESLIALEYAPASYEVVVVDALSRDGTPDLVEEFARRGAPAIRLYLREGNISVGRNEGVRRARGAFVAVTDADVRVDRCWLRELLRGFTWGSDIAAVGGPNCSATDDLLSQTVACLPVHGPNLDEVPLWGRQRYQSAFVSRSDWYTNVTRSSMYRRDAFERVGGFGEHLISTEDPELNARLHAAGYRTAYNPRAVVFHRHRNTLGDFYRQMRHYAYGHADTTLKTSYMRRPKQFLPSTALALTTAAAAAAPFYTGAQVTLAALLGAAAVFLAAYGARCAIERRRAWLVVTAPVFLAAWQLAWALEYPRALLGLPERGSRAESGRVP